MSSINTPIPPKKAPPELLDHWWGHLIIALVVGGIAYYLHTLFTELETGVVDSVRIHWLVALLYNILGHIPTIAVFGLISLGFLVASIYKLAVQRD